MRLEKQNGDQWRSSFTIETIGFGPYSVEFKKNLDMIQECEEYLYSNYKIYS